MGLHPRLGRNSPVCSLLAALPDGVDPYYDPLALLWEYTRLDKIFRVIHDFVFECPHLYGMYVERVPCYTLYSIRFTAFESRVEKYDGHFIDDHDCIRNFRYDDLITGIRDDEDIDRYYFRRVIEDGEAPSDSVFHGIEDNYVENDDESQSTYRTFFSPGKDFVDRIYTIPVPNPWYIPGLKWKRTITELRPEFILLFTFLMGFHRRLGEHSLIRCMEPGLTEMIRCMVLETGSYSPLGTSVMQRSLDKLKQAERRAIQAAVIENVTYRMERISLE